MTSSSSLHSVLQLPPSQSLIESRKSELPNKPAHEANNVKKNSPRFIINSTALKKFEELQKKNVSLKAVAKAVDIPYQTLWDWKSGGTKSIRVDDAIKINDYYSANHNTTIFDIPPVLNRPLEQARDPIPRAGKKHLLQRTDNYSELTFVRVDSSARKRIRKLNKSFTYKEINSWFGKKRYKSLRKAREISIKDAAILYRYSGIKVIDISLENVVRIKIDDAALGRLRIAQQNKKLVDKAIEIALDFGVGRIDSYRKKTSLTIRVKDAKKINRLVEAEIFTIKNIFDKALKEVDFPRGKKRSLEQVEAEAEYHQEQPPLKKAKLLSAEEKTEESITVPASPDIGEIARESLEQTAWDFGQSTNSLPELNDEDLQVVLETLSS